MWKLPVKSDIGWTVIIDLFLSLSYSINSFVIYKNADKYFKNESFDRWLFEILNSFILDVKNLICLLLRYWFICILIDYDKINSYLSYILIVWIALNLNWGSENNSIFFFV